MPFLNCPRTILIINTVITKARNSHKQNTTTANYNSFSPSFIKGWTGAYPEFYNSVENAADYNPEGSSFLKLKWTGADLELGEGGI